MEAIIILAIHLMTAGVRRVRFSYLDEQDPREVRHESICHVYPSGKVLHQAAGVFVALRDDEAGKIKAEVERYEEWKERVLRAWNMESMNRQVRSRCEEDERLMREMS